MSHISTPEDLDVKQTWAILRFVLWDVVDAFFAAWWEGMTEHDMHPHWLDWLQAKAHRQRWKAEKRLDSGR